jgi:Fe-S-cluster containining protein
MPAEHVTTWKQETSCRIREAGNMKQDANLSPLCLNDTFRFSCSARVPCFNECCRNLNQFLTPYDILRLKKNLGLLSGLFLERYTTQHMGPQTGLPIVTLKAEHGRERRCPFVTPAGCSVYQDRPSSCRIYPLVRMVTRSKETGRMSEQYVLLREAHCLGFDREQDQTVEAWIEHQELSIYNRINDMLMEIIRLKNHWIPGQLDIPSRRLFYMACYDLDRFRSYILEKIEKNDEALLKIGLEWIKQRLFGRFV